MTSRVTRPHPVGPPSPTPDSLEARPPVSAAAAGPGRAAARAVVGKFVQCLTHILVNIRIHIRMELSAFSRITPRRGERCQGYPLIAYLPNYDFVLIYVDFERPFMAGTGGGIT